MAFYIKRKGSPEVINSLNGIDSNSANKKLYETESAANSALSSLSGSITVSHFQVVEE